MVNIKNLTPHSIKVLSKFGNLVRMEIPPEGVIARAKPSERVVGTINGVDVMEVTFKEVENLPEPEKGQYYIVSRITAEAAAISGRPTWDLLLTSGLLRNPWDVITGCTGFSRLSQPEEFAIICPVCQWPVATVSDGACVNCSEVRAVND